MKSVVNIHATCVRLGRHGVLLLGKSGAGKSDLALRLIGRGAELVSDDRCDLSIERNRLVARAPRTIAGLLEVHGVGIVRLDHVPFAAIALAVDLSSRVERMPEVGHYMPPKPLGLQRSAQPRLISLNAFEPSVPEKIAAALALLRQTGRRAPVKRN
jgi:hypothetical protein